VKKKLKILDDSFNLSNKNELIGKCEKMTMLGLIIVTFTICNYVHIADMIIFQSYLDIIKSICFIHIHSNIKH
jgi:UDP-N-acetylmuramyl pentapeptide phosphotransferase/UDP-N-acetylglucosamine-1-phosphate transferase